MKKAIYCMLCLMLLSTACLAEEENIRIRLTFAGDVTLGSEEYLWEKSFSFVSYAREHGCDYFLRNVKPLFETDDLTIVNLEGVLSDSAENENTKKTYRFRGPSVFAQILNAGSVEMVSLANNHMLDFGERGYVDTCAALDDAGILRFGGNKNVRAMQSLVAVADLTFSPEGEYLGQQIDLYPAHISGTEQRSNYQPLLVSGADAKRVMRLIQQDTDFELEPFDEAVGYARQAYLPAE